MDSQFWLSFSQLNASFKEIIVGVDDCLNVQTIAELLIPEIVGEDIFGILWDRLGLDYLF